MEEKEHIDKYVQILPELETYLNELIAPIKVEKITYDDWYYKYNIITNGTIEDIESIEEKLSKKFDCNFELAQRTDGCNQYVLDTMIVPCPEAFDVDCGRLE